jgi:aspartyl-tRNA(Asn)/glutamyl-tRNA(Gln) amidotransferase subunit A
MSDTFYKETAVELASRLNKKEISSRELTQLFIDRTVRLEPKIKAFNSWNAEDALSQAEASDQRRAVGNTNGVLDGVPVAFKDVIAVTGQPLTCSSKMLQNYVSPYDATVTTKLRNAGAVVWGRLNLDEFAMGSSTENSAFHTTSNPWNTDYIPGGSSGGSAAAVAAGETPLSLGSDTGGSIRQPAALCGVVGLKPTYGSVSRYGLAAFASSLDQIGPFARTVEDAALLLQEIAGHDANDSTSWKMKVPDFSAALKSGPQGKRIGIPREFFGEGLRSDVRAKVEEVIGFYRSKGYEIHEVSLPHTDLAVPVYYIIATAEASSNLARYDGIRYTHRSAAAKDAIDIYFKSRAEGFGPEVKRRIILGTYVLSSGYYDAYYLRAQKVRTLIRNDFLKAFESVDFLLTPTTPSVAFRKGEKNADPLEMYLNDIFTISVNLAGLPGMSVPCGFNQDKLPVGFQLIGKSFDEANLLAVADVYDREHRWGTQCPEL